MNVIAVGLALLSTMSVMTTGEVCSQKLEIGLAGATPSMAVDDIPRGQQSDIRGWDVSQLTASTKVTNTLEGVALVLEHATSTEVAGYLRNDSDQCLMYGADYSIEYCENGIWYQLPTKCRAVITRVGYLIEGGKSTAWSSHFEWLYGKLPAGLYRIVIHSIGNLDMEQDRHRLSAQFLVP